VGEPGLYYQLKHSGFILFAQSEAVQRLLIHQLTVVGIAVYAAKSISICGLVTDGIDTFKLTI
jgi:hypothetical protein